MTPFNTTTQNLSYSPHKHHNLFSQPPTELHNLHFCKNKWCPPIKFLSDNFLWKHMKSIQIYLSINTNTQKVFIMKSILPTYPPQPPTERHDLFIDTWLKYILKRRSTRISRIDTEPYSRKFWPLYFFISNERASFKTSKTKVSVFSDVLWKNCEVNIWKHCQEG